MINQIPVVTVNGLDGQIFGEESPNYWLVSQHIFSYPINLIPIYAIYSFEHKWVILKVVDECMGYL